MNNDFVDLLTSPKVALVVFGPILVFGLLKGCSEMEQRRPRRR